MRSIELPKGELTLREDAAIDRSPFGSSDIAVRCAAFAIRSTPALPVHPGCEIRLAQASMGNSLPDAALSSSKKSKRIRETFPRALKICWPLYGDYSVIKCEVI